VVVSQETCHAIFSGDVEKLRALRERDGEEFVGRRTKMEGWNFLHMALLPPRDRTPIHVVEYLLQIGVDTVVCEPPLLRVFPSESLSCGEDHGVEIYQLLSLSALEGVKVAFDPELGRGDCWH
jgi:hypothetical protein